MRRNLEMPHHQPFRAKSNVRVAFRLLPQPLFPQRNAGFQPVSNRFPTCRIADFQSAEANTKPGRAELPLGRFLDHSRPKSQIKNQKSKIENAHRPLRCDPSFPVVASCEKPPPARSYSYSHSYSYSYSYSYS